MEIELPAEIRPVPALMKYWALGSLLALPAFPIVLAIQYARYRSLRYRLDEDGISMEWGVLFRREVSLNYGRIQDIHLSSNVVERWFGLGRIEVQTASGSAKAELTIEGVPDLRGMRDFLYERMRGARGEIEARTSPAIEGRVPATSALAAPGADAELAATLRSVAEELRALRATMERE